MDGLQKSCCSGFRIKKTVNPVTVPKDVIFYQPTTNLYFMKIGRIFIQCYIARECLLVMKGILPTFIRSDLLVKGLVQRNGSSPRCLILEQNTSNLSLMYQLNPFN